MIVWGGDVGDGILAEAVVAASPSHAEAHEVRFREVGGPRSAVLLVHYTEEERDRVLARLEEAWDFGYVNAVRDLT